MKKNINNYAVSYVITAFNKKIYSESILRSLVEEGGNHKREYILIDDGSTDGTSKIYRKLKDKLPGKLKIIKQKNMGASAATNTGVMNSKFPWIRLLDGDDIIVKKSTFCMLKAANEKNVDFIYGNLGVASEYCDINYQYNEEHFNFISRNKGLKAFIKNCPANSSSILVRKKRYIQSGGCNELLVSPDQMLFLRLFNSGDGLNFNNKVALVPEYSSKRLSSQIKRSRYESILAIINLLEFSNDINLNIKHYAYKRVLSRAYNYHRFFGGSRYCMIYFNYLRSKIYFPSDYLDGMKSTLKIFTGTENSIRPKAWNTGAKKIGKYREILRE